MTARIRPRLPRRIAIAGVTTMLLAGCSAREPASDAERLARGRDLVQKMSARLAAAPAITVTTSEVRDAVRVSGKKESLSLEGVYSVRRPNGFYAKMTGGRGLESWYNGKTLTIVSHPQKVFAQAPMPDTIDGALDVLAERYDMPLPMGDLFYSSADKALLSDTATGGYAGTEKVGDTPCVHLAFHDTGVDWDLWLPEQGEPLPKRFKVVQKARSGQPVIDVTFTAWNLAAQFDAAAFKPKVPADYEGIAVLQRAAAIKNAAPAASESAAK